MLSLHVSILPELNLVKPLMPATTMKLKYLAFTTVVWFYSFHISKLKSPKPKVITVTNGKSLKGLWRVVKFFPLIMIYIYHPISIFLCNFLFCNYFFEIVFIFVRFSMIWKGAKYNKIYKIYRCIAILPLILERTF